MNQGWTYCDQVRPATAGQTVLDYYTQRYSHSSREQWQHRIEQAQILLDGQPVTAQTLLAAHQKLTYHRLPWQEPAAPLAFEVLYEDEDLWAIAKPSGLPVLPGGGFLEHTLLHQMRSRYPHETPVPVHRLGRGTSGVMLVAKSQVARAELSRQFRMRTAQMSSTHASPLPTLSLGKIYRALVGPSDGPHDDANDQTSDDARDKAREKTSEKARRDLDNELGGLSDRFTCRYPIGKLPYPGLTHLYGHTSTGLPSRSECRVLQRRTDATLVEVAIATGRPHQIRIHLAAAGYPLLGDPLYTIGGIPIAGGSAMPGDCGYHLHAHQLRFTHPRQGKTLCLEAEPPERLKLR